ncbi:glycoside hydrolase family 97 N-terminal domain-containing protein [Roseibacillus persicicus]|uniref:glycoside hydrolase family 97 protein n=1 Tax=Roseibacillus persicicus TaxID=454148 RepID=UPI00398A57B8
MSSFPHVNARSLRTLPVVLFLGCNCANAESQIQSPDGRLSLTWELKDHGLTYQVDRDDETFVSESQTGLRWGPKTVKWDSLDAKIETEKATWEPVWGKNKSILDHYQQASVSLGSENPADPKLTVIFRVYDEGFALRYQIEQGDHSSPLVILEDLTEFNFSQSGTAWSYNGEAPNVGPEPLNQIETTRRLPMTIQFDEESFATIAEAHLDDFSWMDLRPQEATNSFQVGIEKSSVKLPFASPWRAMLIADTAGGLVDANLLENLNPPCAIEDPSWVKPGLTFWDWRTWGYVAPDGFEYGLDMASWKRFIDFASAKEVPYLLLDANWYGPEFDPEMDPKVSRDHLLKQLPSGEIVRSPAPPNWDEAIDVPALIKYGQERGVGIFLYINDKARINYDFEETLATYQAWGAAGIKYGFMTGTNRQGKVNKTNEIIRLCAKYKLMCNFHDGPIPPNGDYRTWPNCTTREYCHAQADAKRSFTPSTFNTSIFVNMVVGPIDMNNGMFALEGAEKDRPRVFEAIPSTIVGECARILATFSGQSIVLDAPESFGAHPELFSFLSAQKQPWQDSTTIAGEIGNYIVMRRTAADGTILLAATTNEEPRELVVPLDFLGAQPMEALIIQDGEDASYLKNQESYETEVRPVRSGESLTLKLAAGGGACVLFRSPSKELGSSR